jgi:hypothetical protein
VVAARETGEEEFPHDPGAPKNERLRIRGEAMSKGIIAPRRKTHAVVAKVGD